MLISFVGKSIKLIKMLLYTICESTKEDKKQNKNKTKQNKKQKKQTNKTTLTVTLTVCGSLRHLNATLI